MDQSRAISFNIIKVKDDCYDIAIMGSKVFLDAFQNVYKDHVVFIEHSNFPGRPSCVIVPDFSEQNHAKVWKEYWEDVFRKPEEACQTCPTVQAFFQYVGEHLK